MTNARFFGPAASWKELETLFGGDHPLWRLPMIEELFFYDGPIVYIGKAEGDETIYLYHRVDTDCGEGNPFPRDMKAISHFLAFSDVDTLKATLHDGTVPTIETYEKATSIIREVMTWRLIELGKPTNCAVSIENVTFADIAENELPYRHLRSGGEVMEFTGATFDDLKAACRTHYVYPLPALHTLIFHDCPRSWIGETRSFGQQRFHLHTMVDENDGSELCYRLTFPDEATLRATLYQGYVATRETFRQAEKIIREELIVGSEPENWTLKIETVGLDKVPEGELPSAKLEPCPKPERAGG